MNARIGFLGKKGSNDSPAYRAPSVAPLPATPVGRARRLLTGRWARPFRTLAGLAQMAVPALAGIGAVLLLGEQLSTRLVIAAAAIFGGVALALVRPGATR